MPAKKKLVTVSPYKDQHEQTRTERGKMIKELVFGVQDGTLTTLGVVTGIAGAMVDSSIIILAGTVALVTEAISMGMGEYLSTKSEQEVYQHEIVLEKKEIEEVPHLERKEVEDIFRAKGFKGKLLEKVVDKVISDKSVWLDVMMHDELGFPEKFEDPKKLGLLMFITSLIGGAVPILPYLFFQPSAAIVLTVAFTAMSLFAVGASKTIVTKGNWLKGGIEMMLIGMLIASIGFSFGSIFGVSVSA